MIIFRTEASSKIGFGHLRRSSYLASLLKSQTEILFCINAKSDKIIKRFFIQKKLPNCSFKELLKRNNSQVKAVIFDLRNFSDEDIQLFQLAKKSNWVTIQITDLGLSQKAVDFTIDSSLDQIFSYNAEEKKVLSGPDYAILHHHFRHFNRVKRKYRKSIKRIFICLGGAIQYRVLRKVIDLFSRYNLQIKVAPGFYLKASSQKILKSIYPGIRFVGKVESLARSFYEADIALITTGVTAFEAAATGTPALYVYAHDEQKFIAQSFAKKGMGLEISNIDELLNINVIEKMKQLSQLKRAEMGNAGKNCIDAHGVYRIIDFLENQGII